MLTPDCPELSIVVPLFNEEEVLPELHRRLTATLETLDLTYEIVFVDDGSTDRTTAQLDTFQSIDPHLAVIRLSRNFGHQAAISAGIDHARGDAVVVLDGDLQDPPELIPELWDRWKAGFDVAYAVRERRDGTGWKRFAYRLFYRLLHRIGDLDIPLDSGDFSLMDRKVVDALKTLPERARFVRGLRSFVGFRQCGVRYHRPGRAAGRPKYTLKKLLGLAVDGLVSFSSHPLRMVTYTGLAAALVAVALTAWVVGDALVTRTAPRGWASLIVVILFMGSVQLISLGIIGEYVRLIFLESKGRPTYVLGELRPARGVPGAESEEPPGRVAHVAERRRAS